MSKSRVSEALEGICGNLKNLNLVQLDPKETTEDTVKEETREDDGGGGDADKEEEKVQAYDAFKESTDEPLPSIVVDERLVAEYRSKLYRFDNTTKQWKEKGIGNITILQSIENFKKCRVVMWTRVTGKVACNFSLFPELSVTSYQKSPKILCWKALDLSADEEPRWETFTCRFLSEEEVIIMKLCVIVLTVMIVIEVCQDKNVVHFFSITVQ